ncbi:unnamed protein product [Prorocentrum cordatum]|uniref:Protein transport protein sec16 n=1 Tax=Prorocentrum cordatum TaxID=2364126 RepID=A0ABN9SI93_9DINO|nr:unnamed protein product [Polarella glacialis]
MDDLGEQATAADSRGVAPPPAVTAPAAEAGLASGAAWGEFDMDDLGEQPPTANSQKRTPPAAAAETQQASGAAWDAFDIDDLGEQPPPACSRKVTPPAALAATAAEAEPSSGAEWDEFDIGDLAEQPAPAGVPDVTPPAASTTAAAATLPASGAASDEFDMDDLAEQPPAAGSQEVTTPAAAAEVQPASDAAWDEFDIDDFAEQPPPAGVPEVIPSAASTPAAAVTQPASGAGSDEFDIDDLGEQAPPARSRKAMPPAAFAATSAEAEPASGAEWDEFDIDDLGEQPPPAGVPEVTPPAASTPAAAEIQPASGAASDEFDMDDLGEQPPSPARSRKATPPAAFAASAAGGEPASGAEWDEFDIDDLGEQPPPACVLEAEGMMTATIPVPAAGSRELAPPPTITTPAAGADLASGAAWGEFDMDDLGEKPPTAGLREAEDMVAATTPVIDDVAAQPASAKNPREEAWDGDIDFDDLDVLGELNGGHAVSAEPSSGGTAPGTTAAPVEEEPQTQKAPAGEFRQEAQDTALDDFDLEVDPQVGGASVTALPVEEAAEVVPPPSVTATAAEAELASGAGWGDDFDLDDLGEQTPLAGSREAESRAVAPASVIADVVAQPASERSPLQATWDGDFDLDGLDELDGGLAVPAEPGAEGGELAKRAVPAEVPTLEAANNDCWGDFDDDVSVQEEPQTQTQSTQHSPADDPRQEAADAAWDDFEIEISAQAGGAEAQRAASEVETGRATGDAGGHHAYAETSPQSTATGASAAARAAHTAPAEEQQELRAGAGGGDFDAEISPRGGGASAQAPAVEGERTRQESEAGWSDFGDEVSPHFDVDINLQDTGAAAQAPPIDDEADTKQASEVGWDELHVEIEPQASDVGDVAPPIGHDRQPGIEAVAASGASGAEAPPADEEEGRRQKAEADSDGVDVEAGLQVGCASVSTPPVEDGRGQTAEASWGDLDVEITSLPSGAGATGPPVDEEGTAQSGEAGTDNVDVEISPQARAAGATQAAPFFEDHWRQGAETGRGNVDVEIGPQAGGASAAAPPVEEHGAREAATARMPEHAPRSSPESGREDFDADGSLAPPEPAGVPARLGRAPESTGAEGAAADLGPGRPGEGSASREAAQMDPTRLAESVLVLGTSDDDGWDAVDVGLAPTPSDSSSEASPGAAGLSPRAAEAVRRSAGRLLRATGGQGRGSAACVALCRRLLDLCEEPARAYGLDDCPETEPDAVARRRGAPLMEEVLRCADGDPEVLPELLAALAGVRPLAEEGVGPSAVALHAARRELPRSERPCDQLAALTLWLPPEDAVALLCEVVNAEGTARNISSSRRLEVVSHLRASCEAHLEACEARPQDRAQWARLQTALHMAEELGVVRAVLGSSGCAEAARHAPLLDPAEAPDDARARWLDAVREAAGGGARGAVLARCAEDALRGRERQGSGGAE